MKPTPQAVGKYVRLQWCAAAILGLGIGAFVLLSYRPAAVALTEMRSRLSESGRELADNRAKVAELPVVLTAVSDLTRQLRSARPIPPEADIGGFTMRVSEASNAVGIGRFSLLPQGSRRGDLCTELPLAIEFEADFKQAMALIDRLDSVPRVIQIRSVKITGRGDGSPLTVKLELSLFHVAPSPSQDAARAATAAGPLAGGGQ
jgi:Tfp pilus assembly protein PilO